MSIYRSDRSQAPIRGHDDAREEVLKVTQRRDQGAVALKKESIACPFCVIRGRQIDFCVSVQAVLPEKGAEIIDGQETQGTIGGKVI